MSELDSDFLAEYKAISGKLKKRFLRRPNVAEAGDQFRSLGRRLESSGCHHHAGLCLIASARCDSTSNRRIVEAEATIEAARCFIQAEMSDYKANKSTMQEHLVEAVEQYKQGVRMLEECKLTRRASSLCIEAAEALEHLQQIEEALAFYDRCSSILTPSSGLPFFESQMAMAKCYIRLTDYHSALIKLTDLGDHLNDCHFSAYHDLSNACELLRVLLVLVIEPTAQSLSPRMLSVLDKYVSNEFTKDTKDFDNEFYYGLQSLVLAVETKEAVSIHHAHDLVLPICEDDIQRRLLRRIVDNCD